MKPAGSSRYVPDRSTSAVSTEDEFDLATYKGSLQGHNDWITQIVNNKNYPNMLVSASRDKSIKIWELTLDDPNNIGIVQSSLTGHGHFVSDIALSNDGEYCLSGSWDKSIRLWDLERNVCLQQFISHTKDVLSVAMSLDSRLIVSGSRDKTIKLWNVEAKCQYTVQDDCHGDWVSCVRLTSTITNRDVVSCSWDRHVKVWDILRDFTLKANFIGHRAYVNVVAISPDASLCASGGKDGILILWNLEDADYLYQIHADDEIRALAFSPTRYWIAAGVGAYVKIWDLENKKLVEMFRFMTNNEISGKVPRKARSDDTKLPQVTSLAWSSDATCLFAGYTDSNIRAWEINDKTHKQRQPKKNT